MARVREQTDWKRETPEQSSRRQSAEKTGRFGLANDALAQSMSTGTPIRQSLASQSLTRRMDQARHTAQVARAQTRHSRKRGSR